MQELRSGPGVRVWACGPGIVFWDKCCVPLEEARGEGGGDKSQTAYLWCFVMGCSTSGLDADS